VALNKVTVTGTYVDGEGNPLTGTVQFTPSSALADPADQLVIRQLPVTAVLSAEGTISCPLYATDNAALAPSGWTWTVTEAIGSLPEATWQFALPHASGATQDISELEAA
jgi:hypothetical protein